MKPAHYRLLTELLAQPTAPFRETHVLRLARRLLKDAGVPHFLDPAGNLIVGCASRADYRRLTRVKSDEPVRMFIAHMDHPGFHGQRWRAPDRLAVKWHGGSPVKHVNGSHVWLATDDGLLGRGKLAKVGLTSSKRSVHKAEVILQAPLAARRPKAEAIYGGFGFRAPVWRSGKRLHTKAADDLIGVFAILSTALELFARRRRNPPAFLGLLTRAEEVGFVGALAHLELGWLDKAKRPIVVVSLETSRTLPGALIGKGPVVRLGDRRTVFDPGYLRLLGDLADEVLPKRHQRRVMDGGTCEATAATAYGLSAIGISVPLGNYHNEAFEGGPGARGKRGPAPEFVHLDDIEGTVTLCRALMRSRLPWSRPWAKERRRLRRNLRRYRKMLD